MILQADLTPEMLAREIADLADSPEKITEMECAARQLARQDAAEATVDIIEQLARD